MNAETLEEIKVIVSDINKRETERERHSQFREPHIQPPTTAKIVK